MSVVTFEALCAKPAVFQSMTGVSVEGFRSLLTQVSPRYEAADRNRAERADRHRAPGGGEKSRHDVSERLLMTLVWLRLYLTCEAIGFLISVDKGTVSRFTRPVLLILGDLGVETLGWPEESVALAAPADEGPDPPDPPVGTPSDRAEPAEGPRETAGTPVVTPDESGCLDHLAIIDATEQRVEHTRDYEPQKRYYLGKRKSHTIKTQVTVNEQGRIRHISDWVPGSPHGLTLLRQSGMTEALPTGLTATADNGDRGLQNDFPDRSVALPYRPKDKQRLTPEEKLHNHFISRVRIVVENTLADLKHFRALNSVSRHCLDRYKEFTRAIAGIINQRIDKRLSELPSWRPHVASSGIKFIEPRRDGSTPAWRQ